MHQQVNSVSQLSQSGFDQPQAVLDPRRYAPSCHDGPVGDEHGGRAPTVEIQGVAQAQLLEGQRGFQQGWIAAVLSFKRQHPAVLGVLRHHGPRSGLAEKAWAESFLSST